MNRPQPSSGTPGSRVESSDDTKVTGTVDPYSDWAAGPHRWVVLDLLDRQIVDSEQHPVGKVDDIYFADAPSAGLPGRGAPKLVSLLSGAEALGQRMGGLIGRMMGGTARRMLSEPRDGARAVPWPAVAELGYVIGLRAGLVELDLEPALEVWIRDNVISPMPGSGHARG